MKNRITFSLVIKVNGNEKALQKTITSIKKEYLRMRLQLQVLCVDGRQGDILKRLRLPVIVKKCPNLDPNQIKGNYFTVLEEGEILYPDALWKLKKFLEERECPPKLLLQRHKQSVNCDEMFMTVEYMNNEFSGGAKQIGEMFFCKEYAPMVFKILDGKNYFGRMFAISKLELQEKTIAVINGFSWTFTNKEKTDISKEWCTVEQWNCIETIKQMSKELYGEIIPFVDYTIKWSIADVLKKLDRVEINLKEREILIEKIRNEFQRMDDMILLKGNVDAALRRYIIRLKYGIEAEGEYIYREGKIKFHNIVLWNLANAKIIQKIISERKDGKTRIQLEIKNPLEDFFSYFIRLKDGTKIQLQKVGKETQLKYILDDCIQKNICYEAEVEEKDFKNIEYMYCFQNSFEGVMH